MSHNLKPIHSNVSVAQHVSMVPVSSSSSSRSSSEKATQVTSTLLGTLPPLQALERPLVREGVQLLSEQEMSPAAFFAACKLPKGAELFTQEDVAYISRLFSMYKIGNHGRLLDLFAFHFSSILQQCTQFSSDRDKTIGQWMNCYLRLYESMMRNTYSIPWQESSNHFQKPFQVLVEMRKITKSIIAAVCDSEGMKAKMEAHMISKIVVPEHIKGKNEIKRYKRQQLKQENLSRGNENEMQLLKLKQICEDWEKGTRLLEKIALHPESVSIFLNYTLDHLPGSGELVLQSQEEIAPSLQECEAYMKTLELGFEYPTTKTETASEGRQNLSACIQSLRLIQDQDAFLDRIKFLVPQFDEAINALMITESDVRKKSEPFIQKLEKSPPCQILSSESRDNFNFVEASILSFTKSTLQRHILKINKEYFEKILCLLDSQFSSSLAHFNRIKETAAFLYNEEKVFGTKEEVDPAIKNIKEELFQIVKHFGMGDVDLENNTIKLRPFFSVFDEKLEKNSAILRNLGENSVYSKLLEKCQESVSVLQRIPSLKGEAKWEQAAWLAQLFVFMHDFGIVVGKVPADASDLDIFPDSFLQWLGLEEEAIPAEIPSIESSLAELPPQQEEGPVMAEASSESPPLEVVEPPQVGQKPSVPVLTSTPQARQKPKRSKQQEKKPIPKVHHVSIATVQKQEAESSVDPQIFGTDPREILEKSKLRDVKKVLKRLGLTFIGQTGGHEKWVHPEDPRSHATVPHHPEIARGTIGSIYNQVIGKQTGKE